MCKSGTVWNVWNVWNVWTEILGKIQKKARHGAGRHWLSDQYSTIGERRKEVRTLPEVKGAASAEREGS